MEFSIRLPPLRPVTPSKTARNAAIALAARTGTPITWVGEAGPGGDELEDAIALSPSRTRRRHQPMP